jgi:flagellar hook-length control protein FliK
VPAIAVPALQPILQNATSDNSSATSVLPDSPRAVSAEPRSQAVVPSEVLQPVVAPVVIAMGAATDPAEQSLVATSKRDIPADAALENSTPAKSQPSEDPRSTIGKPSESFPLKADRETLFTSVVKPWAPGMANPSQERVAKPMPSHETVARPAVSSMPSPIETKQSDPPQMEATVAPQPDSIEDAPKTALPITPETSLAKPTAPQNPPGIEGKDIQPNIATPDIKQMITAVTAATAARVASSQSAHATVKIPAMTPVNKQARAANRIEDLPGDTTGPVEKAAPKPHAVTSREGSNREPASSAQDVLETSAVHAESSANGNAGDESATSQPHAFVPQPQTSSNAPSATPESGESKPAPEIRSGNIPLGSVHDLTRATLLVNSASLLDQMGKSELKLGMRVGDFGSVEIRTQMDRQQLKADISVEHHELGRALTAELPALQQTLRGHDLATVSLNVTGQGAGGSQSQAGYRNQHSANLAEFAAEIGAQKPETTSSPEEPSAGSGLDIRI